MSQKELKPYFELGLIPNPVLTPIGVPNCGQWENTHSHTPLGYNTHRVRVRVRVRIVFGLRLGHTFDANAVSRGQTPYGGFRTLVALRVRVRFAFCSLGFSFIELGLGLGFLL